jgi:NADPH:quinone reductase-like Zn-dependent oxidoreductase
MITNIAFITELRMKPFPEKMKAVFAGASEGQLTVRDVTIPKPGPGDVLVKISAAPVNPSDLAGIRKAREANDIQNFIPGLEGSGTVIAAGNGLLPKLWLEKRVACSAVYHTSGTWAEYMITKAAMSFPLNKNVSDEQGSMMLVNPLTALSFIQLAKENNHKTLINNAAASSLGRMVELIASKYDITVINLVRRSEQAIALKNAGSKYVLNTSDDSFISDFSVLASQLGATILFDSVCSSGTGKMIDVLPEGSTVFIYGNLTGEEFLPVNPRSLIDKDVTIKGFFLGSHAKKAGLVKNMIDLLRVGKLMKTDIRIKIHEKFPLEKVQTAVDSYLENMTEGKVLLIP